MRRARELTEELTWRRCGTEEDYFLSNFWHIRAAGGGNALFELRLPQQQALKTWQDERFSLSLKARQIGWTTLAGGHQGHQAMFRPDYPILDLSKNLREAERLVGMTKYGYDRLPGWMKERCELTRTNLQVLEFDNGSSITSLPSRDDPARGHTPALLFVDEWDYFTDPEEAWASMYAAVADYGQIHGFSTANGYGRWFHQFYERAKGGQSKFTAMFFPWNSVPERDDSWYANQVRDMEPWQIRQEFPSTDEEAFVTSGNPVFDTDMLKAQVIVADPARGQIVQQAFTDDFILMADAEGQTRVWEPPKPGCSYVIGADTSAGVDGGDYQAAQVIKANTGEVVANHRSHLHPDEFAQLLNDLGRMYFDAYLGIERNNHGLGICRAMVQVHSYPNLHFHTRENAKRSRTRNVGWVTNQASKSMMIAALGKALRSQTISLQCEDTLTELITFQRTITRTGAEKYEGRPNDDMVDALAIATMMLEEVRPPEPLEEVLTEGPLTHALFDRLAEAAGISQPPSSAYTANYEPPASKRPATVKGFLVYD